MSDAEWDDESFQPPPIAVGHSDRWEGEDEDTDVKDNWDDEKEEEEEEEDKKPTDNGDVTAVQVKKKKPVKERIAEKAEQRRKELEEKKKQTSESETPMTALETAAEKLRQQKLQEDADLELAIQAFGVGNPEGSKGQIDGMEPSSKEDFDKFEELLRHKITKYEKSAHYLAFLENLFRQLAIDLDAEDIKRLGSTLTALSNEKAKQQKGKGAKKPKQKAKLILGKETDDAFVEGGYDDYEDFI